MARKNNEKFTDDITKEIISLRKNGLSLSLCANYVKISEKTLHNWLNKGKNAKSGRYHQFYMDMENAKAHYALYHQNELNQAKDWKAHRYALSLVDPDYYNTERKLKDEIRQEIIAEYNDYINLLPLFNKNVQHKLLNDENIE